MKVLKMFAGLSLLCLLFVIGNLSAHAETLKIRAGQVKVLPIPNIARVAVGNGQILNAVTDDDKEVVLFARQAGETSLSIWNQAGEIFDYQVQITSVEERRVQEDIRRMVAKIPNVKATVVGQKVIVEGDQLTDADRERLQLLVKHYPQIVDMTSQVGWDQMVMLDVQIVEIPKNFLRDIGVRWQGSSTGGFNTGLVWDSTHKHLQQRPGETAIDAVLGSHAVPYFGINALLSSTIQLMANEGKAVMLAQPQLMARSGSTAEFLAGGEVPYSVNDKYGSAQTVFKPYGVGLQITPRIEKNGIVRSKINVEVSSIDGSMMLDGGPALKIRRTSTEFNVHSGQTLVLSGFISREQMRNSDKIPGLGDIPILGALFKSKRFQNDETELAIFVRPVLVSAEQDEVQQRVQNAQQILDSAFPQAPVMNVRINPAQMSSEAHEQPQSVALRQNQDGLATRFAIPEENFMLKESLWQPLGKKVRIPKVKKLKIQPLVQQD
ncbi:type II and III secretion system protein family protein [Brackiella oedipodis]|uniref:type II and III secretion system protein family protein n=1 Tax=Brackiella oedipodis TaxID=124225 RepID=UPI00068587DC|nr:pilus assembly protein N-terminal domain-containing protein [Brackiella oedipodis]